MFFTWICLDCIGLKNRVTLCLPSNSQHIFLFLLFFSFHFFFFFIQLTNQTQFQNMTGSSVHILYSKLYFLFMHVHIYFPYIVWNNRITTRSNKWRAKVYRFFFQKNSKSKYAFVSNIKTYTEGNDYVLGEICMVCLES